MKRTKKLLVGLLVALSVFAGSLGLAACGGTESSSSSNSSSSETSNVSSGEESSSESPGGSNDDENSSEEEISKESEGLAYTLLENDTYEVSGIGDCTDTKLVIPATYNGKAVTSIGGCAFGSLLYNCSSLTSVVIGDSVTSIGEQAFYDCFNLMSVTIGEGVTSIDDWAFKNCYKLVEVVNKSPHITIEKGSEDNGYVGYYALAVYNSGDTFTGKKISKDNGYIVYTDGTEKILLGYTSTETDLTLPCYITTIHQCAFLFCDSLTSIEIPDSVTTISYHAFRDCTSLVSVVIGDGVTSIDNYAFVNCTSLVSVVIGDSVTSIGNYAFWKCDSLTSITFNGTVEQWNQINKSSEWNYNVPATKVVCSDGEVAL